eukprot:scaffold96101_cov105-Phaeocystis_antarctica.AAC.1
MLTHTLTSNEDVGQAALAMLLEQLEAHRAACKRVRVRVRVGVRVTGLGLALGLGIGLGLGLGSG